jgi:single-stranded-DNA-specific exonuclease
LQIDGTGWTAGVVGLVAGRLAEKYGRPAIVLERGKDFSKGSARSIAGFNLIEALADCADLLDHFGGPAGAGGLTVANDKLEELRERLLSRARKHLTADDLRPSLTLDLDLPLADIGYPTAEALSRLEPFGQGNPEPLILLRAVGVKWPKASTDGKHLFFTAAAQDGRGVRAPLRCVAFGQGARRPETLGAGVRLDLAGTLRREWWQGEERLSFHVRDFRAAEY